MNEASNPNGTASPVMVEDLILTDTFLIKGRLPHKGKRLTNLLEDHTRTFLQVQDATMVALRSNDVIRKMQNRWTRMLTARKAEAFTPVRAAVRA